MHRRRRVLPALLASTLGLTGCAAPLAPAPAIRHPRPIAPAQPLRHQADTSPTPGPSPDRHRSGSTDVLTRAFYGVPILQKSFFWDGNGEVDDSGIGVHALHHLWDGVAIGPGLNAATWWTGGRNVYSAELEGLLRIHPFDDLPVFVDGTTGFQLANDQIPPGGTVWNFSFGFGLGAELPVADDASLQFGALYHHISNALGRDNPRNPSQNEVRIWLGYCMHW